PRPCRPLVGGGPRPWRERGPFSWREPSAAWRRRTMPPGERPWQLPKSRKRKSKSGGGDGNNGQLDKRDQPRCPQKGAGPAGTKEEAVALPGSNCTTGRVQDSDAPINNRANAPLVTTV